MSARLTLLVLALFAGFPTAAQPVSPPLPVVMPPIPPSPIEEFRKWLRLPVEEREKSIADYSEDKKIVLRQKLQEYEAMTVEQRERRLQMLELRWYLRPLMNSAAEQRGNYLDMIPDRLHGTIAARLQRWDGLPVETRRELLASDDTRELVTRHFVHLRRATGQAQETHPLNESQRTVLQESLKRWHESSPAHRERMGNHLASFFESSKSDQDRALDQLSESERGEIQKTLDAFAGLSPEHRRACVHSFQKFATMTPLERGAFLRNAERWQQMTLQEREAWKRLVPKLPPMPPAPAVIPPLPQATLLHGENLATVSRPPPAILSEPMD